MPSAPSEQDFKTRVLLLLGAKWNRRETKWELVSRAGWHLRAKIRDQYLQDMIDEGLITKYKIITYRKPGRRPIEFELTDKGRQRYREEAKNHRKRISV